MSTYLKSGLAALCLCFPLSTWAQSEGDEPSAGTQAEGSAEADLLTQAELETLVAPVALYPDTLLIQILVAATYPLEIVKADRFLDDNADSDPEALKAEIEDQGWDESVAVLATAFPDVISDMADHVEWSETVGDAMLAQSDDVLSGVQTMRNQAINSGALVSGEAQKVEVEDDKTVVIQPTDPEVVYIPEYDANTVYDNSLGSAVAAGAVAFGTFAVIDAIFDDDDDWNDYWGCRNCGGWNDTPIIRSPDIDIDVDGNVNIGDRVGDNIDRPDRPDGGWKPDPERSEEARDKIGDRREEGGKTKLPVSKGDSRGDALRGQLSEKSGAPDISRDKANLPKVDRPSSRPDGAKKDAIKKTAGHSGAAKKAAAGKASGSHKAAVKKAGAKQPTAARVPHKSPGAIKKRGAASRSIAGANRGGHKAKHRR